MVTKSKNGKLNQDDSAIRKQLKSTQTNGGSKLSDPKECWREIPASPDGLIQRKEQDLNSNDNQDLQAALEETQRELTTRTDQN
jgi:hypothetical protein